MPSTEQLRSRLLKKLAELFQLDQPDLDFGFYRIMHAKAREVQDFIGTDLLKIVADAFGAVDEARKAELQAAYEKAIQTAGDFGESEYQFVTDLKGWCDGHKAALKRDGMELFLLRNMSRGKGVGFFEAGNFHPDFILWMLAGGKQYISFIEPHGLLHEGPASGKVLFHKRIKDVEQRLKDPTVILNSFILSWTPYPQLKWGDTQSELEDRHVLFMTDDRDGYIDKLFAFLQEEAQHA